MNQMLCFGSLFSIPVYGLDLAVILGITRSLSVASCGWIKNKLT
jgi:hypothetical protein